MGCVSSKEEADSGEKDVHKSDANEEAKKQRRRLSVTPQHVGDITKGAFHNRRASVQAIAGIEDLNEIELKGKGDCECVMFTKTGKVPHNANKRNQDRAVVKFSLQDKDHISMFGVCDGHGEFGHDVAEYIQQTLPKFLAAQDSLEIEPVSGILAACRGLVQGLKKQKIHTAFSGSTCVFAVKLGNTLYCANIGDSRCVVIRKAAAYEAIGLSEDQKPENPGEKERILAAGGRVEPLPGPPNIDRGPERVWLANENVPGLAMSRSIGDDVSQTVGVISVPEIKQYEIDPHDVCVILASDGVWEFIDNDEACAIVSKHLPNYQKACNELCKESIKRWQREEEVIDDITCVILGLKSAKSFFD